jgi:hypothetical protein
MLFFGAYEISVTQLFMIRQALELFAFRVDFTDLNFEEKLQAM